MYPKSKILISALFLLGMSALAQAAGPHEDCKMCHVNADDDPSRFVVKPDDKTLNPRTGKPLTGVSAICISCHKEVHEGEEEAVKSIALGNSHPVGIAPNAKDVLPKDVLEFTGEKGLLSCGSCHNWHPDNKNYKYLRWEVTGRYDLNRFCSQCHKNKANAEGKGSHGECAICHSSHEGQGMMMITEVPNTTTVNPNTNKPLDSIGTLCMSCHATEPDGAGYRPINLKNSHPTGVAPSKAKLPAELAGVVKENVVTCISCHDQHPANANYAYLRWPIKSSKDIPDLCGRCHADFKDKVAEAVKTLPTPVVGAHKLFKDVKKIDDYLNNLKQQGQKKK